MGARVSRTDFIWTESENPHVQRRRDILKAHPEIKRLMGHDSTFKWVVTAMVLFQFLTFWYLKDAGWVTLSVLAYCLGGVVNHSLTLAIHDISHSMAFGHAHPTKNKLFGMFANLPIGIPIFMGFKKYHLAHHRHQGNEILDPDVPSLIEAKLFCTTFTKVIWLFLQPFFYVVRPLLVNPMAPARTEIFNYLVQISFNLLVSHLFGWHVVVYMIGGTIVTMGLHPIAGHFISEHYMFAKGFETYSYYGSLNAITFNVGYHMEHHDFPNIASSRLPQVKKMAPEFYDNLPHHNSWIQVLWDFVTDPAVGPYARVKRRQRQEAVDAAADRASQDRHLVEKVVKMIPAAYIAD